MLNRKKLENEQDLFMCKDRYQENEAEKNFEFKLEEKIAVASVFVGITALSIYTFTLGYLDGLSVPEFPSYTNSLAFFTKGLFLKGEIASSNVGNSVLIKILYPVLFLLSLAALVLTFFKDKPIAKKLGFVIAIVGSAVLVVPLAYHFEGLLNYLVPVCSPVFFALYSVYKILDKFQQKVEKGILLPQISLLLFLNISAWMIPYLFGKATLSKQDDLRNHFPKAWTGAGDSDEGWLIWMEDDRRYWFICEKNERVIYGKNSDGKIFFSRTLAASIADQFCGGEETKKESTKL